MILDEISQFIDSFRGNPLSHSFTLHLVGLVTILNANTDRRWGNSGVSGERTGEQGNTPALVTELAGSEGT